MTEYACRDCHRIVSGQNCPACGSNSLSKDWSGYVLIIDPELSEIAVKLNITTPGAYALKVR
ncbi:MAG: DNA-directed RNA polymerase, subunit E'' [Methanosarcinales archaeon]|nr:DNA-directed RNA polymerase, subunit E'' [Methanosarcinales archaeon]HDJ38014.1 DNA-directed RNA polymerase, subunit E'' [Methanosarcinales archaeon]